MYTTYVYNYYNTVIILHKMHASPYSNKTFRIFPAYTKNTAFNMFTAATFSLSAAGWTFLISPSDARPARARSRSDPVGPAWQTIENLL